MGNVENRLNKPVIIIGIGVILLLIALAIFIIFWEKNNNTIQNVDNIKIETIEDVGNIESIAVREKVESLIRQGTNDCYQINGEYYVILSTGNSQFDIGYTILDNGEENQLSYWVDYSSTDAEFRPRYKIIKVDKPIKVVSTLNNTSWTDGIVNVIIQNGIMYNLDNGQTKSTDRPYTNGIYSLIYKDGNIVESKYLKSYNVDCTIISKNLVGSYKVGIGDYELDVELDKLNLSDGEAIRVNLYYEDRIKGKIL